MWDLDQVGLNNGMGNPDDPTRADPILLMAKGFIPSVGFKDLNNPSSFYLSPHNALSDTVGYQLERPYMHIQTRSGCCAADYINSQGSIAGADAAGLMLSSQLLAAPLLPSMCHTSLGQLTALLTAQARFTRYQLAVLAGHNFCLTSEVGEHIKSSCAAP